MVAQYTVRVDMPSWLPRRWVQRYGPELRIPRHENYHSELKKIIVPR
jgi:hypothetical protein